MLIPSYKSTEIKHSLKMYKTKSRFKSSYLLIAVRASLSACAAMKSALQGKPHHSGWSIEDPSHL